jgi:hypothetical protein
VTLLSYVLHSFGSRLCGAVRGEFTVDSYILLPRPQGFGAPRRQQPISTYLADLRARKQGSRCRLSFGQPTVLSAQNCDQALEEIELLVPQLHYSNRTDSNNRQLSCLCHLPWPHVSSSGLSGGAVQGRRRSVLLNHVVVLT